MAFKLKTSKETEEIFNRIEASENLAWPTLMRLALALSIKQGSILPLEMFTDNLGRELNRQTITGDAEVVFKCLIQIQENRHLSDDEYFPAYIKAHLDRGARLLDQEQRYSREFLVHMTELGKAL